MDPEGYESAVTPVNPVPVSRDTIEIDATAASSANGMAAHATVRARPGRLCALGVSHRNSVSCGASVWAQGA